METIKSHINLTDSTVSEKLDGICGIWDGRTMRTRSGNTIHAPQWWTRHLPNKPLTGELWTGRGRFEHVRSIVCSRRSDQWHQVRFGIFEADPDTDYGPHAFVVEQHPINSRHDLDAFYKAVLDKGGEGVVVTAAWGKQYKVKPSQDSEGELIEHIKGTAGKWAGMVSGLVLRLRDGRALRVSAGLDIQTRKQPPAIGSIVRFTFKGLTSKGMPRHAAFAGLRAEASLEF